MLNKEILNKEMDSRVEQFKQENLESFKDFSKEMLSILDNTKRLKEEELIDMLVILTVEIYDKWIQSWMRIQKMNDKHKSQ